MAFQEETNKRNGMLETLVRSDRQRGNKVFREWSFKIK